MEGETRPTDGASSAGPALVLLPTLNEAEGLEATLAELERVVRFPTRIRPSVLVVDARSTDGTLEVAARHGVDVLQQTGTGKGAAIREGLAWAADHGYGAVGVLDADGTYPPDRLPALFGLLDLNAEVVLGVRRPDHPASTTPRDLVHRLGNGGLNLAAAKLASGPILDVCTGFWGVRTEIVPGLALQSDGFEIESELFVKSFRAGLHVVQMPVEYRQRIGEAKLHAARDGARIFLSIVRHARSSVPLPPRGVHGAPPERSSPSESLVRDVASILVALGPPPIAVYGAESRDLEAEALVRSLRPYGAGVERIRTDGNGGSRPRHEPSARLLRGLVERGLGVVTLPERARPARATREALLDLPAIPRRIRLVPMALRRHRSLRTSVAGALTGAPSPDRAPRTLEILSYVVNPWGGRGLELIVRANAAGSNLRAVPAPDELPKTSTPGETRAAPARSLRVAQA